MTGEFRRGFVERLHAHSAAFLRHAARLREMTPLRDLLLTPTDAHEPVDLWEQLAECPALDGLADLSVRTDRPVRTDELRRFAESEHLADLRMLGLIAPGFDRGEIELLTRCPLSARLMGLHVVGLGRFAGRPYADLVLEGPAFRHLEVLYVCGMVDVDAGLLGRLPETAPFGRLRHLKLVGSPVGDVELDPVLDWLPPTLTKAGFNDLGLGNRAAASLARTPRLRQFRWLDLSNNQITDIGAMALADSPNLLASTKLDLRGNPIGRRVQNALRIRCGHHVRV